MSDQLVPHGHVAFTGAQARHISSLCRPVNGVCQGGACRGIGDTTTRLTAATAEVLQGWRPPVVPYEAHEEQVEDNRRRRAAGMPERRGKWGSR